jgi:hypothetical protein
VKADAKTRENVMKTIPITRPAPLSWLFLLVLVGLLPACNAHPSGQAGQGSSAPAPAGGAPPASGGKAASGGSVCDRHLITAADVAGIVEPPIVGNRNIPGDPQSCTFETSGFAAVVVSLRPANGRITVETWTAGRMPVSATPLAGVGGHAAWVPSLNEVDAEKDDVLCVIEARMPSARYRSAPAELQQRLGALCNKIFAANAS